MKPDEGVKRRWRRPLLGVMAAFGLTAVLVGYFSWQSYVNGLRGLAIGPLDLTMVADGEYEGEYDGGLVKAKVRVTVAGHRITDLTILKHDTGLGRKAESIVDQIVRAQSLAVDTVAGATCSSKVILKATEAALRYGTFLDQ